MIAPMIRTLFLFIAFLELASCYDGLKLGDLLPDTAAELKYMVEHYPDVRANCTGHPVARSADFFLYNGNNPIKPIILDGSNLEQINPSKDVIVLIHGWLSSASSSHIIKLKDAYLERYDANVISIDWSKQTFQPYTKAYCDVPGIARAVAQFLCTITRQLAIPLSTLHVVGHTFGGQIAGFAGQYVAAQCKQQIGRITGLDPAGPVFWNLGADERLDKKDALFVDVIHADELSIGTRLNCGGVDFHPNCGLLQPGCPSVSSVDNDTLVSDAICSSLRSLEFMTESIHSNEYIAISCGLCARYCSPDIINEVYAVMGEECRKIPKPAKNFYIPTKSSSPYAEGWDPYPNIDSLNITIAEQST